MDKLKDLIETLKVMLESTEMNAVQRRHMIRTVYMIERESIKEPAK